MMQVTQGHLGGYVAGGDDATFYPDLWNWFVNDYGVQSVLDVGCGEGHSVDYFEDTCGIRVVGVDGIHQDHPRIITHDFTKGPLELDQLFDLVWCCEFVEHIEEQFIPNFLAAFQLGHTVAMTHAEPGQLGYHHVNCRSQDYWIGVMAGIGYRLNPLLTLSARQQAALNPNPWNHFKRSGMIFLRHGNIGQPPAGQS